MGPLPGGQCSEPRLHSVSETKVIMENVSGLVSRFVLDVRKQAREAGTEAFMIWSSGFYMIRLGAVGVSGPKLLLKRGHRCQA